ncbi:MAG: PAS domain-containing protein, partial [Deltaproteobacteria bacterium]|nr:PAS domain-containing protein [Deltaproteobacteria bacterium]
LDRDLRVTAWNLCAAQLFAIPRERALARPLFELLADRDGWHARLAADARRALAGETAVAELAFPPRPHEATITPLGSSGVVVALRDLAGDAQRFRVMADSSPVLLWLAGRDALCTFFNQQWLAFTGRTMAQELGNGWAEGVHHEDFQPAMDTYLDAFVARRPFRMEYRLRRADGAYRWLLDTGVPHFLPSGEFAGYIGSCIDITEQKAVRDELDLRVRERTAELEAFAYSVSHDLRTPLRSIDGFGRALEEAHHDVLDERGRDYLARVRAAAQHMGKLIDGLLQLSRIGRSELELGPCDLSQLARDAALVLREQSPGRTVDVAIEDGIAAPGDAGLLRIVLDNLIGNAWKFTAKVAAPRIEVFAERRADAVTLAVRDNGAGFDMTYAGKLFGAFQRLHRQSEFPGTGIGLATVAKIAGRHRGRVWAESAAGAGATFYVQLPC